ncbi:MAG TPA: ABC transporter permease subunit [Kofleriaceae bacterium]|nr:ABC transporter permease subunit [Kofleriaceae bacterium]
MATITIFRRELGAYLRSPVGWIVAAVTLLLQGILFQVFAARNTLAGDMLSNFYMWSSIVIMIAAVILSIRLISDERQSGALLLLNTSPVREVEVVAGKFLAALTFLGLMLLLSLYIPLLIKSEGKITPGQIFISYLGLFLAGGATLAIGLFASSLARQPLVAAVVGAAITGLLSVFYQLSRLLDPPMKNVFAELDLWWLHFQGSFMRGIFDLKDVVYYLAMTYIFLLLSVKTLEAKRWQ